MKLCVFQGTFNPIHNVHLAMAHFAQKKYKFETVVFVPAYKPPHKDIDDELATHRYNMVKLAIEGENSFQISNIEYQHERYSYTYLTIQELKKRYGVEGRVSFLIGTDAFREIDGWYEADKLKKEVHFIVFPRTANFDPDRYQRFTEWGYSYEFAPMNFIDLSSTVIRHRTKTGKPLAGIVPPKVQEYIRKNGLYLPK